MTAHGSLEADFPPGAMVAYTHTVMRHEPGLVVRANDDYVFVRFKRGEQSSACRPYDLTLLVDPIPDPRIQMIEDVLAEYRRADEDHYDDALLGAITDCLVGAVDSGTEEGRDWIGDPDGTLVYWQAEAESARARLAAVRYALEHPGRDVHDGSQHVEQIREALEEDGR